MAYEISQDRVADRILHLAKVNKMPLPEKIKERPNLLIGLEMYWEAFWRISTCRAMGMIEGPIPWLAMKEYADEMEFVGLDRTRFYIIMSKMDETYIKIRSEEVKKKRENASG